MPTHDVELMPPNSPPDDPAANAAKKIEKTNESFVDLIKAVKTIMPDLARMFVHSAWTSTIQFMCVVLGGLAVLSLCFMAGTQGKWDVVEKIAIPVLAFFGGLLAGRKG